MTSCPPRGGLSHDGTLYAAPFYGESSMIMYRKDLLDEADMTMPDNSSWDHVADAAAAMTDTDAVSIWYLSAWQAGLGRQHGIPNHNGKLFRRPMVQSRLDTGAG